MPRHWGLSMGEPTNCQGLSRQDVTTGGGYMPGFSHMHSMRMLCQVCLVIKYENAPILGFLLFSTVECPFVLEAAAPSPSPPKGPISKLGGQSHLQESLFGSAHML